MPKQRSASRLVALGALLSIIGAQPALGCALACLMGVHTHGPLLAHRAPVSGDHDQRSDTMRDHHHASAPVPCHGASLGTPTTAATMALSAALVPRPPIQQWTSIIQAVPSEREPLQPRDVLSSTEPPPPRSV